MIFFFFFICVTIKFFIRFFREDFDHEEKARFGELCSGVNGKGREWFAKYVSAQVGVGLTVMNPYLMLKFDKMCLKHTASLCAVFLSS